MENRLMLFSLIYVASLTNTTKIVEKEIKRNLYVNNNKNNLSILTEIERNNLKI